MHFVTHENESEMRIFLHRFPVEIKRRAEKRKENLFVIECM